MALSIQTLQDRVARADGATLAISGAKDGLDLADALKLFTSTLPAATLTLTGFKANTDKLSGTGSLTLLGPATGGAVTSGTASVVFLAAGNSVAGVVITMPLPGWQLAAKFATFAGSSLQSHGISNLRLVLAAGQQTVLPGGGYALQADLAVKTKDGSVKQTVLTAPVPRTTDAPRNYEFSAQPSGLTIGGPADLVQFVSGADFSLPGDFGIALATSLDIVEIGCVIDPTANAVTSFRAVIRQQLGKQLFAHFEIESFDFGFVILRPASGVNVIVQVGAHLKFYSEEIDILATYPDLSLEGSLQKSTPVSLQSFIQQFRPSVTLPGDLKLTAFVISVQIAPPYSYSLWLEADGAMGLPPLPDDVKLEQLSLKVNGAGTTTPDVLVGGRLEITGVVMYLEAGHTGSGWSFRGGTYGPQEISFVDWVAKAAQLFGVDTLPATLHAMALTSIDLSFETGKDTTDFAFDCRGKLEVSDVKVGATLNVKISKASADKSYKTDVKGTLTIATPSREIDFTLVVQKSGSETLVIGTLASENKPVGLNDLASALGFNADIPDGFDINLKDLGLLYQTGTDTSGKPTSKLILTGNSSNYGNALLVVDKGANTTYLFGLNFPIGGSLSKIPLVGVDLPPSDTLALNGLQLLIPSRALTADVIGGYNTLLGDLDSHLPKDGAWTLAKQDLSGASLTVNLMVGTDPRPILLTMPPPKPKQQQPARALSVAGAAPAASSSGGSDNGMWLNLEKTLGPLYFKRVGIKYAAGEVDFVLDASLKISALTLSLIGAGVGSPIKSFSPHFRIDGLAIDFESGPVILSGGLIAVRGPDDKVVEYDGQLTLAAEEFELAAIAGYSTQETSMFAFAILEAPLGGPPFLFVTGVAAGFGYNRDLKVPDAAGLPQFPLVQAVMGQSPFKGKADPGNAISVLREYIPVKHGENWVALGIRFTTFELLKSFALVIAKFGGELEFDLIGMSALSIPSEVPSPIAYAELALVGSFKVEEGSLAISAQLTPASFVLDRNCHLTGGFAFYFWGKDSASGARAGDFVVTLGGYHPAFKRPNWYPVEPLLGANWQVSSNLTVKGGYYFALTPSTVMAGGMLEAVWESGDLKAWFNAHADFLLCWKPFHYQAEIGISLGASYRVNLLFTSFTVTVHVGVEVDFWGPSFAGRARVDLYVCTLTVTFGDSSNAKVTPIPWDEFKTTFLPPPAPPKQQQARAFASRAMAVGAAQAKPYSDSPYVTLRAAAGLTQDLSRGKRTSTEDMDWVVNAEVLQLVTLCVIPSTTHALPAGFAQAGKSDDWNWNKAFGVGPVGIDDHSEQTNAFVSSHAITLVAVDQAGTDYKFDAAPVLKSVPKATWSKAVALNPGIATANTQPATIDRVLTGFSLQPTVVVPDQLSPIDLKPLQFSADPTVRFFNWAKPDAPPSDQFSQANAMKQFTDSLANADVGKARDALLAALKAHNVADLADAKVDVSRLAQSASDILLSPPVLSYLGDQRKAA